MTTRSFLPYNTRQEGKLYFLIAGILGCILITTFISTTVKSCGVNHDPDFTTSARAGGNGIIYASYVDSPPPKPKMYQFPLNEQQFGYVVDSTLSKIYHIIGYPLLAPDADKYKNQIFEIIQYLRVQKAMQDTVSKPKK
jgi:hypothetical protein